MRGALREPLAPSAKILSLPVEARFRMFFFLKREIESAVGRESLSLETPPA